VGGPIADEHRPNMSCTQGKQCDRFPEGSERPLIVLLGHPFLSGLVALAARDGPSGWEPVLSDGPSIDDVS